DKKRVHLSPSTAGDNTAVVQINPLYTSPFDRLQAQVGHVVGIEAFFENLLGGADVLLVPDVAHGAFLRVQEPPAVAEIDFQLGRLVAGVEQRHGPIATGQL